MKNGESHCPGIRVLLHFTNVIWGFVEPLSGQIAPTVKSVMRGYTDARHRHQVDVQVRIWVCLSVLPLSSAESGLSAKSHTQITLPRNSKGNEDF